MVAYSATTLSSHLGKLGGGTGQRASVVSLVPRPLWKEGLFTVYNFLGAQLEISVGTRPSHMAIAGATKQEAGMF